MSFLVLDISLLGVRVLPDRHGAAAQARNPHIAVLRKMATVPNRRALRALLSFIVLRIHRLLIRALSDPQRVDIRPREAFRDVLRFEVVNAVLTLERGHDELIEFNVLSI